MIITFVFEEYLNTLILPENINGKYYLKSHDKDIIGITGERGKWILKSNKNATIIVDNQERNQLELKIGTITILNVNDTPGWIFCDKINPDVVHKYAYKQDGIIKIGRDISNTICYKSEFASSFHATLEYKDKTWTIIDNDSSNWTFVNNVRIKKKTLNYGDLIYIIGLKIIVGYDFLVVLEKGDMVDTRLEKLSVSKNIKDDILLDEENSKDYFKKTPRFKKKIISKEFKIDAVPSASEQEEFPAVLAIGSSFTMGIVSISSVVYSISNGTINILTLIMAVAMLMGTLLMPLLLRRYNKKLKKKKNLERREKYTKYLANLEKKMDDEVKKQEEIMEENYPSLNCLSTRILNRSKNLWERSCYYDDFLDLRIGTGSKELDANIEYQSKNFSLQEDDLQEKMYALGETKKYLQNTPITLSFYKNYFSCVIGSNKSLENFAKNLLTSFSALYSYDELKMVFVKNANDLEYVKWLPHTFSNDSKSRYLATNEKELKELSFSLQTIINTRLEDVNNCKHIPYYVIFILDQKLGQKLEVLNKFYNVEKNIGFSIIHFSNQLQGLPRECTAVIELDDNLKDGTLFERQDEIDVNIKFKIDDNTNINMEELVKSLSNIELMPENKIYKLPNMISFLEMFKVGKIEHLNLANRWIENDPTESLATPIGINEFGEEFSLDLHEKYHGPHGLVAGMTGSGKSEFIMTYILSLALNYQPCEVSFILIDYKGGGMAKTFKNLPHTAGIITNLDGSLINRCLTSINSELKRRQKVLDLASQQLGISNIDIYKYQKLYREKKVDRALPHLFIISDEFAELKSQQPEFMQELISTARIGRSLGIHLILATQKPSGVVNEQIWSNSKFKICLKVASKQDSMEMLKRSDAAELKQTGRFYLQVGYDELFKLGQSAWAGAPYIPDDEYVKENKDSICIINNTGQILKEAKFEKEKKIDVTNIKQIDAIVKYINEYATLNNIHPFEIWLPQISENITLEEIQKKNLYQEQKYIINPLIGEYDDIENQKQEALSIPVYKGNTVIYGSPDSGKDVMLQTIIYSMVSNHSSNELNLYIVDLGSESLKMYHNIPQVGEILTIDDQDNMMDLFVMLDEELDRRRLLFSDYNGSYLEYNEKSGHKVPLKVCIINNYDAFSETFSRLNDLLSSFYRECVKYGICFIITCDGQTSLRMKVSEYFTNKLCLNMAKDEDYRSILGASRGLKPMKYLGRGIVLKDENCYEFQTAFIDNIHQQVKQLSKSLENVGGAEKIPVLPEVVTLDLFKNSNITIDNFPIGYEVSSKQQYFYNFKKNLMLIAANEYDELKSFIFSMYKQMKKINDYETVIIDFQKIYKNTKLDNYYTKNLDNILKDVQDSYSKKVYIFIGLSNYQNILNEETSKKLTHFIEHVNGTDTIIIMVDNYVGVRKLQLEMWYVNTFDKTNGIWIGCDVGSQQAIRFEGMSSSIRNYNIDNMAFVNDNGEVRIIKHVIGGVNDGYNE